MKLPTPPKNGQLRALGIGLALALAGCRFLDYLDIGV